MILHKRHHTNEGEGGEYDEYPEDEYPLEINNYPKCEVPKRVNSFFEGNSLLFWMFFALDLNIKEVVARVS